MEPDVGVPEDPPQPELFGAARDVLADAGRAHELHEQADPGALGERRDGEVGARITARLAGAQKPKWRSVNIGHRKSPHPSTTRSVVLATSARSAA